MEKPSPDPPGEGFVPNCEQGQHMSTSKTPDQRYREKLVPREDGHLGWGASVSSKGGTSKFSYTAADGRRVDITGHLFGWELMHGPLPEKTRLRNTCGMLTCQSLDHWEIRQLRTGTLWEQYESMFTRGGPNDCWPWQEKSRDKDGYGLFSYKDEETGKWTVVRATRWAWERLSGRPLAPGMYVCHRCDNPPCQNPAHWFEGTPRANNDDMHLKERANCFGKQTMTWEKVYEMRRMDATEKYTHQQIADYFGADRRHVTDILNGKIWKKR